jgi:hypothetical protein
MCAWTVGNPAHLPLEVAIDGVRSHNLTVAEMRKIIDQEAALAFSGEQHRRERPQLAAAQAAPEITTRMAEGHGTACMRSRRAGTRGGNAGRRTVVVPFFYVGSKFSAGSRFRFQGS